MLWIRRQTDRALVLLKLPKTNPITPSYLAEEEEEEEAEYPRHEEDLSLEVGDPISQTSPVMSVANRDTLLATALNTAGINLAAAKLASRKRMTTMNRRNPYR